MDLLLDALQALGVAAAIGLRPFLPVLAVGAMASGDLGIDFDGTDFSFLESPGFLAVIAAGLAASILMRARLETGPGEAALSGLGIGLAALVAAGTLDDRHDTWWYGVIIGVVAAFVAGAVARELLGRVRTRFLKAGDTSAAGALTAYAEGAALVGAVLSIALPPLGLVLFGFLIALGLQQRRRAGEKYAGLRILR